MKKLIAIATLAGVSILCRAPRLIFDRRLVKSFNQTFVIATAHAMQ
jgi:hypothetical protein